MADIAGQSNVSFSLGGARKTKLPINGVKRPHSALLEDEDDGVVANRSSAVSHFDNKKGGAIDASRPRKSASLVIPSQKNRDWKEASKKRRQHGQIPTQGESAAERIAAIEEAERREKDRSFGLNVMKQDEQQQDAEQDGKDVDMTAATPARDRTADERAMDALLGREEQSTLVVPAASETDAFRDDFRSAPEMATLDDYARVPVEEFGAAMLRGMGWKDGDGVGTKKGSKAAKTETLLRRPALLGIGAKSDAAIDAELGGWGKAARGKEIKIYNPVLLKDKKTGELFTEEELSRKREDAQRSKFEEEFEQREKDRERRKKRDDSRDRHSDHRDERRRSRDRHRSRRDDDRPRDERRPKREYEDDRDSNRRSNRDRDDRGHRSHRDDDRDHKHRGSCDDDKYDRRDRKRDDRRRDRPRDHKSSRR